MDYLVMKIGTNNSGATPCSIYSTIINGVQEFSIECYGEVRHKTRTLTEMIDWYWEENSVHYSTWENLLEYFFDSTIGILDLKDERNVYLDDDMFTSKVFQIAYFLKTYGKDKTLEDYQEYLLEQILMNIATLEAENAELRDLSK